MFFLSDKVFPWYLHNGILDLEWLTRFFFISGFLLLVGLVDDLIDLGAIYKLFGQLIAAILMFLYGNRFGGVFGFEFPIVLDFLATILWFTIFINAFNLIDGYDGLASGLAVIAALGIAGTFLFRHMPLEALFMVGFIGSCLAFLRYNVHPARIFLGDSGSMLLGFTLASFTLATTSKGTGLATIWIPLLAVGVPIFDVFLAFWRRVARNVLAFLLDQPKIGGVFSADMGHLHHRLVNLGFTPRNVTAVLYLANSALVFLGLIFLLYHDEAQGIFSVIFVIVSYLVVRHVAASEIWQSGLIVVHGLKSNSTKFISYIAFALLDALVLILIFTVVEDYYSVALNGLDRSDSAILILPWWSLVVIPFILSIGPYRYLWKWKPLSHLVLGFLFVGGFCLLVVVACLCAFADSIGDNLIGGLFVGGVITAMLALRLVPRLLEEFMHYVSAKRGKE